MKNSGLKFGILVSSFLLFTSCNAFGQSDQRRQNQKPPSIEQIFADLDKDEDGLISKKEIKASKELTSQLNINSSQPTQHAYQTPKLSINHEIKISNILPLLTNPNPNLRRYWQCHYQLVLPSIVC